jgi:raffinose/stachyose/melibiose transport system substrate-binding protein
MEPESELGQSNSERVFTRRTFLGATLGAAAVALPASKLDRMTRSTVREPRVPSTSKLSGTLNYYDHGAMSTNNTNGKKLIAAYEKLHPDVKVNVMSAPPADIDTDIFTLMEGGSPPDLFTTNTNMFPWYNVKDGWWLDLTPYANAPDPYVSGNKAWKDLIEPSVLSTLIFKSGQMYSLTTTGFDCAFFYNKEIFKKIGAEPPTTWAELIKIWDKAKAAGYIPFYYELGDIEYATQAPALYIALEDTFMRSSIDRINPASPTGQVTIAELVKAIKDGLYSAKNSDYQALFKFMKSLLPYMQRDPGATTGDTQGIAAFETGTVATWFEGSFNAPLLSKVDWGAFVVPNLTTATSPYGTSGPQAKGAYGATAGEPWCVPAHTKASGKLDLVIDFLYWLSAPAQNTLYSSGNGTVNLERGGSNPPDTVAFVDAANHLSRFAVAELSLPQSFTLTRCRAMEGYVLGAQSLNSAMAQMQSAMDSAATQATTSFGL